MSWAKIDDRANENHKLLEAGAEACWLWSCGLMYANRQATRDGFIPELALGMLYPFKTAPKKLADKLVASGLWERTEKGYQIHAYHRWNPTPEQLESERAAGRERAAKSYESRKAKNRNSSPDSSPEEPKKNPDSSGVEWSGGVGLGSDLATTGSTPPETACDPPQRPPELQRRASLWVVDPNKAQFEASNPHKWPETSHLVSVLAEVFGGSPQVPRNSADPRVRVLLSLWADGRTNDELEQAIRGAGLDGHIRRNPQFQTLQTVLKDSAQVDRFMRMLTVVPAPEAAPKASRGGAQLDRQLARVNALEAQAATQPKALP